MKSRDYEELLARLYHPRSDHSRLDHTARRCACQDRSPVSTRFQDLIHRGVGTPDSGAIRLGRDFLLVVGRSDRRKNQLRPSPGQGRPPHSEACPVGALQTLTASPFRHLARPSPPLAFDRRQQLADSGPQFIRRRLKGFPSRLLLSCDGRWIRQAPMQALRGSGKEGTGLSRVVADGDHVIEGPVQELVHVLGAVPGHVDALRGHRLDGQRVDPSDLWGTRCGWRSSRWPGAGLRNHFVLCL